MSNRLTKFVLGIAGVAALAVGGSAIAGAATSSSTTTTTTTTPSSPAPPGGGSSMPTHGTPAHEDAEKAVTGTAADQAKAAAVEEVGSGTAGDVTTDFSGNGYEVTVTKSDGSTVEIHLDSSFNALQHGGPPNGTPPPTA